ncbi:MAG: hypothetical protein E7399_04890 [Ruminococcaceae bacterium]|nr:hypothetical protein [Oscillospiraceae bacterium]
MRLQTKEIAVFGILGALMYVSKFIMELFPNIHLIGVFVVAMTAVYRKKALYSIYIYVFLCGLLIGFGAWWIPQLYIWTVLWGMAMLIPEKAPQKVKWILSMIVCSLHGFTYGILYAPVHALLFGLDWNGMIAWIAAGAVWDMVHGVSNLLCSLLIVPLINLLKRIDARR